MKRLPPLCLLFLSFFATAGQAAVYEMPTDGSAVVGTDTHIQTVYKDTLLDIARRNSLGYYEIIRANPGVDMWLPGEGTDVMLPGRRILPPGPREGIVVNLPEHRLYYYPKPKKGEKPVVITYPVSIGKMDWKTPLGETHVIQKQKHPSWYPPEGVRKEHIANGDPLPAVVKPGPDNPLGDYAMRLAAGNGTYLIHGTNNPMAVGMAITHGCVRMYPEDVAALFPLIPVGTKVWLVNEPVKVAFVDGELLMEAHPPVDDEGQNTTEPNMDLLSQKLDQVLGSTTAAIHWDFAKQALQAANGIPTVVGIQADMSPEQAAAAEAADSATHSDAGAPDSVAHTDATAPGSQHSEATPASPSAAGTSLPSSPVASDPTQDPAPTQDQHTDHQASTASADPRPAVETLSRPETTLSQVSASQDAPHPATSPKKAGAAQSLPAPDPQAAASATAAADTHRE
jgi:L,D-transpeptidase ErfK/SrfK